MLYLVRGLPGSGKSTFARSRRFAGCLVLENDMYHIHNGQYTFNKDDLPDAIDWCKLSCRQALERGMDVVVSNTFTKTKYLQQYVELAKWFGTDYKVYKCTCNYGNVHNVPDDVLAAMESNWDDWPGEIPIDVTLVGSTTTLDFVERTE